MIRRDSVVECGGREARRQPASTTPLSRGGERSLDSDSSPARKIAGVPRLAAHTPHPPTLNRRPWTMKVPPENGRGFSTVSRYLFSFAGASHSDAGLASQRLMSSRE